MIKAVLAAYATSSGRKFVDREQTVGASEVGQCARRVFYEKMHGDPHYGAGKDPDFADTWGAKLRGTAYEEQLWFPALKAKFGDKLLYAGPDQRTLVDGYLSATPDGLLVDQPRDLLAHLGVPDIGERGELVVECKTIDPRARLDHAKAEHAFQTQVQLGLLHELTPHRPKFALISYADASFWDEVTEFVIAFDPQIYANAKARADRILLATDAHELEPEGWIAGGKECARCPYTRACDQERTAVPYDTDEKADPQFVAEIADLARAAKAHEVDADTAAATFRKIQHEIRERLREKGLRRVSGFGVRVSWSPVKGRTSIDLEQLRAGAAATGFDVSPYEKVGDPSDRLVIQTLE
jgi:hypothetical protein